MSKTLDTQDVTDDPRDRLTKWVLDNGDEYQIAIMNPIDAVIEIAESRGRMIESLQDEIESLKDEAERLVEDLNGYDV